MTLAVLLACRPDPAPARGGGNVLLVVLDDIGVRDVGTWGDPDAPPTPVLDELASTGIRFLSTWVSPVCSPTRASILTGRHGTRTGVGVKIDPGDGFELADEEITIPEVLAESRHGYTSIALGKWHLASAESAPSFDAAERQGFDVFRGAISNVDRHSAQVTERTDYFHWERCVEGSCALTDGYATSALADDAIELLAETPEPWFMYAAFNAAHDPYHVPPEHLNPDGAVPGDPLRVIADAMVRSADLELGRVLDSLDPRVRSRTTIVVVADNGTPGTVARPPDDPERVKHSVYEGGIHVPMIVSGAGVEARGRDCAALVHGVDLLPTIALLGGVSPDRIARADGSGVTLDGQSLLPYLVNPDRPGRERLFTAFLDSNGPPPWPGARYAVRDERFKLVSNAGTEELYDLSGGDDDGPDLLATSLEPEAESALQGLREHLAASLDVPYDH